jgi:predicted transcriptional regulator
MNQTVTISAKTIDEIFSRLDELTRAVKKIAAKLSEKEPLYGSDEWWDKEIKEAREDIEAGRYTTVNNRKELRQFLASLKA